MRTTEAIAVGKWGLSSKTQRHVYLQILLLAPLTKTKNNYEPNEKKLSEYNLNFPNKNYRFKKIETCLCNGCLNLRPLHNFNSLMLWEYTS